MTTGQQDAPLWDWNRIDEEMERQWKAHGGTYQFIWVRELCRQICDDLTAELELAQGMLQQTRMESNMIFDRGAQRLARIKELEAHIIELEREK